VSVRVGVIGFTANNAELLIDSLSNTEFLGCGGGIGVGGAKKQGANFLKKKKSREVSSRGEGGKN